MAPGEIIMAELDRELINITPDEILAMLRGTGEEEDPYITELVRDSIEQCRRIMAPAGAYLFRSVASTRIVGGIEAGGIQFRTGKFVREMLQGATEVAFFIATAGAPTEELARKHLSEGSYLEGFIIDLIGSEIADRVAGQVHHRILLHAQAEDRKVTNRYSPGYCSWNVREQQKLFSLFPDNCCGITLSDSCLMLPIKSVSGMIGIGAGVSFRDYLCDHCNQKNCNFRRPEGEEKNGEPFRQIL